MTQAETPFDAICIGGGPAGLTSAYMLGKDKRRALVLEADPVYVGGISRTIRYKGFCFDIGGHRFFSKSAEVNALWDEILAGDFITRPRKSRIYYKKKFYPYPLEAWTTLWNIGPVEALMCVLSYVKARIFPIHPCNSFEAWVINHFGERLYRIFFKTYTEKVWGMPCNEISADWAAQRIKGLSLSTAIMHALLPAHWRKDKVKTLINSFQYPKQGPGMMWEKAAELIAAQGNEVKMGSRVTALAWQPEKNLWKVDYVQDGATHTAYASHVISSMPLRELVHACAPLQSLPEVLRAADALHYRDFLIVALIVQERFVFDDNWLYIHDPNVKVGRIQNFKSWSPYMVPDTERNCYGMEYFCFEGDGLWDSPDDALVELAGKELVALGLADSRDIIEGVVVRQRKAYPVYDGEYKRATGIIRDALAAHCPNLHVVGRAGMHKYNNQDHAMMTAMLTVRNIAAGKELYDVWHVNQDAEYHESGQSGSLRAVPQSLKDGG